MMDFTKIILSLLAVTVLLTLNNSSGSSNLVSQVKTEIQHQFLSWIQKHGKRYSSETQKLFRLNKFMSNYKFIQSHNKNYEKGIETFQVSLNKFADIDNKQYIELYLSNKSAATNDCKATFKIYDQIPYQHDWSPRAVTPVKNAGQCRSSWAFAAVGALQGLASLSVGSKFNFSAQQLVDCSGGQPYQNKGCNGGQMQNSFWYVIDNGITTQQKYPYTGRKQNCSYTSSMKAFQNTECAKVKANNRRALQSAALKNPVAVWLDGSSLAFQFYKRGVFSGRCGTNLNIGMVLTGYGTINDEDYWKCKSSLGDSWGQQGYIFLHRDKSQAQGPGQCGVQMQGSFPI